MGGVLDSARFAYLIAAATGAEIADVDALVMGAHGDAMVPMPRLSTVRGRPLTEVLSEAEVAEIVSRTVAGGAEVVALLKTGCAFYAPGACGASMGDASVKDSGRTMPSCVLLEGEYGISDVHMSVPARLGRDGVLEVVQLDLVAGEVEALQASARQITEQLAALEAALA